MNTILIIGAGQLGSRHLQGCLRLDKTFDIYVLDSSEQSLEIARERAKEIPYTHRVNYTTNWNNLPSEFYIVIIATGANVRAKIVTKLLEEFKVKKLILEKILFQDLKSYEQIRLLIDRTKTPTWVNHPRRMFNHYEQIKEIISETKEKAIIHVTGGNWGLACNALHFIDLFAFLTGQSLEELDMDWIDQIIHESKRVNYIEYTGSVKGRMKDGSSFVISSVVGEISDIMVQISTNSNRWIVLEGNSKKVIHLSKQNDFIEETSYFIPEFQSTLTTKIVHEILEKGKCRLPTYDEAAISHTMFIDAALKKYIEITKIKTDICPIT